ncbi:MAG: hypothetical protein HY600_04005 [Candidatus Omnitrophica bacterium]|nr:hypothetical protein [Candidatus Omnitrophota bacterium]
MSEDTYERYQRILKGKESADSMLREKLRPLMETNKISAILGLRHTTLDEDSGFGVSLNTVGHHLLMHNLLVQIPLLEPFKATVGLEEDHRKSSAFDNMS